MRRLVLFALAALLAAPAAVSAEEPPRGGVQWFATWVQAKAEARRSGRPILLVAAAPHCHHVSGMW